MIEDPDIRHLCRDLKRHITLCMIAMTIIDILIVWLADLF